MSVAIQKKIIKNVIKLAFFTGLLRQLLRNFLAMTTLDPRGQCFPAEAGMTYNNNCPVL